MRRLWRDESGASLLIALVFFMICLVVGAVVVGAASVNARAYRTAVDDQQLQNTVGSAARTVGEGLSSASVTVTGNAESGSMVYSVEKVEGSQLAQDFWNRSGSDALRATTMDTTFSTSASVVADSSVGMPEVKGTIEVDRNLNVTVRLSVPDEPGYAMTVLVKAVPTYNNVGTLVSVAYEEPQIWKTAYEPGTVS